MATRLTTDETRISFEGIRKQIHDIEASIEAVYNSGTGPQGNRFGLLDNNEDIRKTCILAIKSLEEGRGNIEKILCWFD